MNMDNTFNPGTLVRARGRDWVVQTGSTDSWLKLRPMGGAEDEVTALIPALEREPVTLAKFPYPDPAKVGPFYSAELLYDALRFQLRSGAGPFRSFGSIAVEPRSYQLVPLLMAMRQEVVRLLIADDVGIGKTIEAGLIVRELLDRGEVDRFAVLCPPHLVEQWVAELDARFNLKAEPVTAGTANRLEKLVPHGKNLADVFPYLVVSLDYIKTERHRDYFLSMGMPMIVVDEAHTCTKLSTTIRSKQLRFELLKELAADESRHMLFLTATPHSGNEEGFHNLLSLLKPEFAQLSTTTDADRARLRRELAKHFVQRRRVDIREWRVAKNDRTVGFPERKTKDVSYKLSAEADAFLDAVRDYCREMVLDQNEVRRRIMWHAAIAMLRCASSSPAAAVQMLLNRMNRSDLTAQESDLNDSVEDEFGEPEDTTVNDVEPTSLGDGRETELLRLAQALKDDPAKDAKLKAVIRQVTALLKDGFNPVIFCRYIATAHYVAEALKKALKKEKTLLIECVTGEFVPEERKAKVEALGEAPKRILVATDCLSEGINLQEHLNAVIHYDLAWNPTRHEQREGRIDRFGQRSPEVRAVMLVGENNPVDGFILDVILRKSETIRESLGVTVPVPLDRNFIEKALLEAALFRDHQPSVQPSLFDAAELDELTHYDSGLMGGIKGVVDAEWENALDKMKKTRTIFAQSSIHPEEIYPLWEAQQEALGGFNDVEVFCREASASLGIHLEKQPDGPYRIPLATVQSGSISVRLQDEGFDQKTPIWFNELHRSSPLVTALSEGVVAEAMGEEVGTVVRSAVTESEKVKKLTRVYLLRLRYQMRLAYRNQTQRFLMAEEILPVAASGRRDVEWTTGQPVRELIHLPSKGNVAGSLASRQIEEAVDLISHNEGVLANLARKRAAVLKEEHAGVKQFTAHGSVVDVEPCLPVDVMGVFVILPSEA